MRDLSTGSYITLLFGGALRDFKGTDLGVAAVMAALPLLIPAGILLIRRLQTREVQL